MRVHNSHVSHIELVQYLNRNWAEKIYVNRLAMHFNVNSETFVVFYGNRTDYLFCEISNSKEYEKKRYTLPSPKGTK